MKTTRNSPRAVLLNASHIVWSVGMPGAQSTKR